MKKLLVLLFILLTCSAFAGGLPGTLTGVSGNKLSLTGGTLTGTLAMADDTAIEIATGTLANLSFRFRSDANTGVYSSLADVMDFVTGGTMRARITSSNLLLTVPVGRMTAGTGQLAITAASSTLPSFSFNSDLTTGLGRYAVGQPSMIGSGTEIQRWTNIGTTNFKAVSHIVAGGGYTTYQGNTVYSATGEDSVTLPLNAAATSIAFDAETSGYIRAEIVGTNSTDTACIHVTLTAAFEDFGDTLAFVGSPASLTDQLNAATWSASLSASGDDLSVIATGAVGTLWQVKKLEIGGL